jgi:hypothetical protein
MQIRGPSSHPSASGRWRVHGAAPARDVHDRGHPRLLVARELLIELRRDRTVPPLGGVLVDQRRPGARAADAGHELLRRRTAPSRHRRGVVTQIMRVQSLRLTGLRHRGTPRARQVARSSCVPPGPVNTAPSAPAWAYISMCSSSASTSSLGTTTWRRPASLFGSPTTGPEAGHLLGLLTDVHDGAQRVDIDAAQAE